MNTQTKQASQRKFDHSVFDADMHGQALNLQYLRRILRWVRPHRNLAFISIALVLVASLIAVLLPVIISRVVIDGIILGEPNALLPDFGMNALNRWLSGSLNLTAIISACLVYGVLTALCHLLYHLHLSLIHISEPTRPY